MIFQMLLSLPDLAAGVFIEHGDFVGFTFLLGTLAMWGAGIFFLFERAQVPDRWKTSLLVAALVTLIAGMNYVLMSAMWLTSHVSPAEFRYLDWFLTVPLICLQFYLLLEASGTRPGSGMLWRLVGASLWMLAAGYVGQEMDPGESVIWGAISSLGYAFVLFEISFGEARYLSRHGDDPRAQKTFDLLFRFIFIGWAIYPLGYMTNPDNLLSGWRSFLNVDAIYNVGDAVNKIGFGLVVWNLARAGEQRTVAIPPGMPPPQASAPPGSGITEPSV